VIVPGNKLIEELQVTIAANRRLPFRVMTRRLKSWAARSMGIRVIAAGEGGGADHGIPVHKSLPLREQVRWTAKCFVVIWLFERGRLALQPFEVSSQVFHRMLMRRPTCGGRCPATGMCNCRVANGANTVHCPLDS
jgi:hypothetical protein